MIRSYVESDRAAVGALDSPVVDGWHRRPPALHLVATSAGGRIVGHLQTADRRERALGFCETILRIADDGWEDRLPDALLDRALAFAREREAKGLQAAYLDDRPRLAAFLLANGFVPFERYLNSRLDLAPFDPSRFGDALRRVESQGVRLLTYAEAGDSEENRRSLYALECAARSVQPFREAGAFVPPPFPDWERELSDARWDRLFLARAEGRFVGMVTGFEWGFTGVHPAYQGRGIATALKVWSLTQAKAAGVAAVETENHEDNTAMLAVNRRLGFVPGVVETNCRRRLGFVRTQPSLNGSDVSDP